ncbi:MAG TPA: 4-(cytidine 5'-diphospho)-2-C-methyl-D-erythritol kinase [Stellaceae bacterium]|nr:4-(cytidine 5'-diphospho)-2-C-methyl-D-erythritol kinase [Stellaceae bacterium]
MGGNGRHRGAAVGAFAPAKINLYLHVVGRRPDGHHLLDSLIAFADIGDRVTAAPADRWSLAIGGPEAGALAALGDDNLVLRAARLLAEEAGRIAPGATRYRATLRLDKALPEASGIGGGSSDAAAALRALDQLWHHPVDRAALAALALRLGADVPACLAARPVWVGGIGERIEPETGLPPAGIVLANPRRRLPTAAVFAARRGAFSPGGRFAPMPPDAAGLAEELAGRRNDLTEAALTLAPEIAAVLDRLAGLPGSLIARMSGSGATCFALFADLAAALAAGAVLARAEPAWWSAAGALLSAAPALDIGDP